MRVDWAGHRVTGDRRGAKRLDGAEEVWPLSGSPPSDVSMGAAGLSAGLARECDVAAANPGGTRGSSMRPAGSSDFTLTETDTFPSEFGA